MAFKINPFSRPNPDTGFGVQASRIGGRFLNKDGTFNLYKKGPLLRRMSVYAFLMELSWARFLAVVLAAYLLANLLFTGFYLLVGMGQLAGFEGRTPTQRLREVFYFSSQTFTTVGYGRISPVRDGAHLIALLETFSGWLFFALVTGLLYGRFTRPKAYISFSQNALISPYQGGLGLMFRMVPFKTLHHLTDARVAVNLAMLAPGSAGQEYRFFQLALERSRVDIFNMNWTVVHPINAESPLLNLGPDDLPATDMELYVQVSGFDPLFSNQVMARTSYTHREVVWGAKFLPMYYESEDGSTTVLELDKVGMFERTALPQSNGEG